MQTPYVPKFIKSSLSPFDLRSLNPANGIKSGLLKLSAWALPAFLFVAWAKHHQDVEFYSSAVTEGIGPNLWNAIGSFGLFFFGLSVVLPKSTSITKAAYTILDNTFAIGCLTIGLLIGQWFFILIDESLVWWHRGLFGVISTPVLAVIIFYNLVIWYLSFLVQTSIKGESSFLFNIQKLNIIWRLFFGLIICSIITLLFMLET